MGWLGYVYFWSCAIAAVAGALGAVGAKNPIRGAMGLLTMILAVAGLFLALHAQFLAAVQVIVYAGAIVVLFIFVIMLLGPSATPPRDRRGLFARTLGSVLFGLMFAVGLFLLSRDRHPAAMGTTMPDFGGIDMFGRVLFSDALVPFELSSALLIVAVLGAVAVARGRQGEPPHVLPNSQPGMTGEQPTESANEPEGASEPSSKTGHAPITENRT